MSYPIKNHFFYQYQFTIQDRTVRAIDLEGEGLLWLVYDIYCNLMQSNQANYHNWLDNHLKDLTPKELYHSYTLTYSSGAEDDWAAQYDEFLLPQHSVMKLITHSINYGLSIPDIERFLSHPIRYATRWDFIPNNTWKHLHNLNLLLKYQCDWESKKGPTTLILGMKEYQQRKGKGKKGKKGKKPRKSKTNPIDFLNTYINTPERVNPPDWEELKSIDPSTTPLIDDYIPTSPKELLSAYTSDPTCSTPEWLDNLVKAHPWLIDDEEYQEIRKDVDAIEERNKKAKDTYGPFYSQVDRTIPLTIDAETPPSTTNLSLDAVWGTVKTQTGEALTRVNFMHLLKDQGILIHPKGSTTPTNFPSFNAVVSDLLTYDGEGYLFTPTGQSFIIDVVKTLIENDELAFPFEEEEDDWLDGRDISEVFPNGVKDVRPLWDRD